MEVWYDIDDEDEDLTLEDFLDKKMGDWELSQVESVYSLACSCLHERKNRRPFIKQVQGGQTDSLSYCVGICTTFCTSPNKTNNVSVSQPLSL